MIRNVLFLMAWVPLAATAQSDNGRFRSLPTPPAYEVITDHDGKVRTDVLFKLCLDPEGRIACLEPLPDQNRETVNAVMQRVPGWRFTPARLDGKPVEAESTLMVFLEGAPDESGRYSMRITHAATGPRAVRNPHPRYPLRQLRRMKAGYVLLKVEVQADGSVAKVEADARYSDPAFVAASEEALRRWTFEPERVAGQAVATRVIIPVAFHIDGQPRRKPLWSDALPDLNKHPVALNSAIGPIAGSAE